MFLTWTSQATPCSMFCIRSGYLGNSGDRFRQTKVFMEISAINYLFFPIQFKTPTE